MHVEPNATLHHNPAPDYIRGLVERIALPRAEICAKLGVSERTLKYWLAAGDGPSCPYTAQYTLERLAEAQQALRCSTPYI